MERFRFEGLTLTVESVERSNEPWERAMTAFDPGGYAVEFAQGRRGQNQTSA